MGFEKANRLAYVNFLRAKYESWTGEVLVKSYPYILGIDPSSICQLRCPACPTGIENENKRAGKDLAYRNRSLLAADLFDALLDELGDFLFVIQFYNWGEPLLNKNLPGFVRKAKSKDIHTEIHTNLSLRLTDQYIEELLTSGIDDLNVSIDGFSPESYQTYRRGGNYRVAKTNIEKLVQVRDRLGLKTNIIWNFLVFRSNEHEIDAVRHYCEQLGIVFNRREAFVRDPDWLPSYRKDEFRKSGVLNWSEPSTRSDARSGPATKNLARKSPCAWHYCYSIVNADGSVSPCCAVWEQKDDFGAIRPGSIRFAEIWNNDLFRKSRGTFAGIQVQGLESVDTLCLRCPYNRIIQNMLSYHDLTIRQRFQEVFRASDYSLERAFSLLDDEKRFVEFFKNHLIADFSRDRKNEAVSIRLIYTYPEYLKMRLISNMRLRRIYSIWRTEGFRVLMQRIAQFGKRRISRHSAS